MHRIIVRIPQQCAPISRQSEENSDPGGFDPDIRSGDASALAASATGSPRHRPARRRPPLRGSDARADVVDRRCGLHRALDGARPDRHAIPSLRVVVLEQETVGFGASGRNGGFCQASLTHGFANGIRHFPDELDDPRARGHRQPRAPSSRSPASTASSATSRRPATLSVADQPHQVEEFRAWVDEAAEHGEELEFLDRAAVQAEVHSPLWLAGLYQPPGRDVILDPAKLVRGLARVCEERGVAIHEGTRVRAVESSRRRRSPDDSDAARNDRRRPRRRRDVGVLGLAAPASEPVRAGLRLRPRLGPADARRSAPRSAGIGARACRTRTTSSTTSG